MKELQSLQQFPRNMRVNPKMKENSLAQKNMMISNLKAMFKFEYSAGLNRNALIAIPEPKKQINFKS